MVIIRRQTESVRRGLAALEVVLATGITMPVVFALAYLGVRACKNLFHVISTLVDWPLL
jgi:hypothetical protein